MYKEINITFSVLYKIISYIYIGSIAFFGKICDDYNEVDNDDDG